MKPVIGFVMLTHTEPTQALRLCQRLGDMFSNPPIAVHHDFGKADLDISAFPTNVRFVEHWVDTGWGTIGVVDALLAALRLLYDAHEDNWGDPDWFVSLSAADYPIQTADFILDALQRTAYDGFLDFREIGTPQRRPRLERPGGDFPFAQPGYQQVAFLRYKAIPLLPPGIARRFAWTADLFYLTSPWLVRLLTPFHDGFQCYAGDAWMTMRRNIAHLLLQEPSRWRVLYRHFASRPSPEEAIYHTYLCNLPGLRLSPDNLRYTDWRGQHAHPRTLEAQDVPLLMRSRKHFARKLPNDTVLLAELDRSVTQVTSARCFDAHPSICIIIPICNAAPYLARTIESALAQTYTDFEIIVVDDGSTDETAQVIAPYFDRIRYITQQRSGLPAARYTGICASRSSYIALLDVEDVWPPDKLARLVPYFRDPEVNLITSALCMERDGGQGNLTPVATLLRPMCSSMLLRRKAVEACRFFVKPKLRCDELKLFTELSLRGKVIYIREPLSVTPRKIHAVLSRHQMQDDNIIAIHALLGNVQMSGSTRKSMRHELGLNYFLRGNHQLNAGNYQAARHDWMRAFRYSRQVRWRAFVNFALSYRQQGSGSR